MISLKKFLYITEEIASAQKKEELSIILAFNFSSVKNCKE